MSTDPDVIAAAMMLYPTELARQQAADDRHAIAVLNDHGYRLTPPDAFNDGWLLTRGGYELGDYPTPQHALRVLHPSQRPGGYPALTLVTGGADE